MPVIILGGIYAGIFTPTESAVVAVVYGLIVCLAVYREISMKTIWEIVENTAEGTANLMIAQNIYLLETNASMKFVTACGI